jgi:NOL1/NOP2/fmu family ribosome biogenesis protein
MSDQTQHDHHIELTPEEARQGFRGADVLAVLAVSTFLAAVGLTAFFVTTALGG